MAKCRMRSRCLVLLFALAAIVKTSQSQNSREIAVYLTAGDRTSIIAREPRAQSWRSSTAAVSSPLLNVDETTSFQTVEGFGFTLTGGSAQLIHHMDRASRHQLLEELFGRVGVGIGVSYLRVSVGSSDMNDHTYSYDDMPAAESDATLVHFTMHEDEFDVIPILQEILQIAPELPIIASPWTAPSWMKSNDNARGGKLKHEYYQVYAQYLVSYLAAMKTREILIVALRYKTSR